MLFVSIFLSIRYFSTIYLVALMLILFICFSSATDSTYMVGCSMRWFDGIEIGEPIVLMDV